MNDTYVNLGLMQKNAARTAARKAAVSVMNDHCVIERPAADGVFNRETGDYTEGATTVIYEGPCRFKSISPVGQRNADVAFGEMVITMYDVILPYDEGAYGISISDHVIVNGNRYPITNVDMSDRNSTHVMCTEQARGVVQYG